MSCVLVCALCGGRVGSPYSTTRKYSICAFCWFSLVTVDLCSGAASLNLGTDAGHIFRDFSWFSQFLQAYGITPYIGTLTSPCSLQFIIIISGVTT